MNFIIDTIESKVKKSPASIALQSRYARLSFASLWNELNNTRAILREHDMQRIGLLMDNGPAWAVIDLAALSNRAVLVPLPDFFTDDQLQHVIKTASLDTIITDNPGRLTPLLGSTSLRPRPRIAGQNIWQLSLPVHEKTPLPQGTVKITFTSGTTGFPKGVCLTEEVIGGVAQSLSALTGVQDNDKHVALLPMAVLLENIAGLYVSLLRGVPCVLPSLRDLGMDGSRMSDLSKMFSVIKEQEATSIIMIPQMLQALILAVNNGLELNSLRFAAVGGGSVSPVLLEQAATIGLPVFEGYGLSECASVVAVNTPEAARRGSVGKPLPHLKVDIAPDNEILVNGPVYAGYLGESTSQGKSPLATGDLGYLDDDGYLYVNGRKKNMFITSYGRNVSPEWIERELHAQPAIAQAVVFGESRPWNTAVIVPQQGAATSDISVAVRIANRALPDYAQVSAWIQADEPFTTGNGQFTANGRPRRAQIWKHYEPRIDQIYEPEAVCYSEKSQ